jgi:hypothetical protein
MSVTINASRGPVQNEALARTTINEVLIVCMAEEKRYAGSINQEKPSTSRPTYDYGYNTADSPLIFPVSDNIYAVSF